MTNSTATNAHNQSYECPKCEGNKILPEYRHYAGGVCFLCKGQGFINLSTWKNNSFKYEAEYMVGWIPTMLPEGGHEYRYIKKLTVWVIKGRDITVLKTIDITTENRDEAVDLWKWAKAQGIKINERYELDYNPQAQ